MINQIELTLPAYPRGFHLITHLIVKELGSLPEKGLLNIFIKHTSAALMLNENADPSVRQDMESVYNRLIPESYSNYVHNMEGGDDMPAHAKTAITGSSINIPISGHQLNLGTWQGIYLCEFRNHGGRRRIIVTVLS